MKKLKTIKVKSTKCSHKFKNGKTAWVEIGGFIYVSVKCKICGERDYY